MTTNTIIYDFFINPSPFGLILLLMAGGCIFCSIQIQLLFLKMLFVHLPEYLLKHRKEDQHNDEE